MNEINDKNAKPKRVVEPMNPGVAQGLLVTLVALIATPAVWAITGDWRWAVGLGALTLMALVWTALVGVQSS